MGLTPELLPAIVTVTLSRGAQKLARAKVLVRRLVAIENLGAIDVLCTDKTGTLTEGQLKVSALVDGSDGSAVGRWARINAQCQDGMENLLDRALIEGTPALAEPVRKLGELPYDFERRCLSVVVEVTEGRRLVCKGAVPQVLERCRYTQLDGGRRTELGPALLARENERLASWSAKGLRVLAVAIRHLEPTAAVGRELETGLDLIGYVLFEDPVKKGVREVVEDLRRNGVELKIVSGDNRHVAGFVAEAVGLSSKSIMTGEQLQRLGRRALIRRLAHAQVFAEVTPDQKERIIESYRRSGRVVGYLGDGINDAPALRAADLDPWTMPCPRPARPPMSCCCSATCTSSSTASSPDGPLSPTR